MLPMNGLSDPDSRDNGLVSPEHKLRSSQNVRFTQSAGELEAFLALGSLNGIGQKRLFDIASSDVSFSEALDRVLGRDVSGRSVICDQAKRRMDEFVRLGISVVWDTDPSYPQQLRDLPRPPRWLFVQGDISRLSDPILGFVGTRRPSDDGLFLARYVGACLRDWQLTTVSGLATGIDTIAHEHSIRAGIPTVAVLGTNILEDYPRGSGRLRRDILASGGAIVSEYLPSVTYSADNFIQRNRIQAALSRVLLPVEWHLRSGTAHTVRFAVDLKRTLACVRMQCWSSQENLEASYLRSTRCQLFTLPQQHSQFYEFVKEGALDFAPRPMNQMSLFGG
jgi:DNA processing protein